MLNFADITQRRLMLEGLIKKAYYEKYPTTTSLLKAAGVLRSTYISAVILPENHVLNFKLNRIITNNKRLLNIASKQKALKEAKLKYMSERRMLKKELKNDGI